MQKRLFLLHWGLLYFNLFPFFLGLLIMIVSTLVSLHKRMHGMLCCGVLCLIRGWGALLYINSSS